MSYITFTGTSGSLSLSNISSFIRPFNIEFTEYLFNSHIIYFGYYQWLSKNICIVSLTVSNISLVFNLLLSKSIFIVVSSNQVYVNFNFFQDIIFLYHFLSPNLI